MPEIGGGIVIHLMIKVYALNEKNKLLAEFYYEHKS